MMGCRIVSQGLWFNTKRLSLEANCHRLTSLQKKWEMKGSQTKLSSLLQYHLNHFTQSYRNNTHIRQSRSTSLPHMKQNKKNSEVSPWKDLVGVLICSTLKMPRLAIDEKKAPGSRGCRRPVEILGASAQSATWPGECWCKERACPEELHWDH